jgi:hypothetical protein
LADVGDRVHPYPVHKIIAEVITQSADRRTLPGLRTLRLSKHWR